jgi:acyl transferase domain-containing protein/acyl carrier protein
MSDFLDRINKLSPKRLALLALEQHEQLEAAERQAAEPIAVIGMACRFPGGADNPAAFWELLQEARDATSEVPPDRWDIDAYFDPDPDAPAKISARNGGFLSQIGEFDAAFFGIAPREALTMDPQQRLLLETSWQALEHAGIAAEGLVGSLTGVFVGVCNSDYSQRLRHRGEEAIDAYLASGNALSVAAGRVAYCLGLQGPALAIDTACSSSLVALHAACRSVRSGESRLALAAGVNLICAPETMIALTKGHMLAPDGRCKTFDAAADGFSRGEGCGVVVLKRLSAARADGDRVLALIKGSAVNQDGRSGGLTVPNGPSQENVIRAALRDAGVEASDIDYVEAHGTGTTLGDPIEVRALAGALGAGRSAENALLIGSVKTNIGHLESAAGIAGVIKVILSLQQERIPPHLHFREPSPHIAWSQYPVRVVANGHDWPRNARRRLAGVSSFGFSGTNAHVVVEEAPEVAPTTADTDRPVHCLALSARSKEALRQLAGQYAQVLSQPDISLADVAHTAGAGRSHFAERVAVVAEHAAGASEALRMFGAGNPHETTFHATAEPGVAPAVVFLFTGQGSQYPGMTRQLYETSPVFRAIIDRCDALLGADAHGNTLKSVLEPRPADDGPIHDTAWTQPALFAVEYGLAELWRSWGIEPSAVIGHSVGEYVAACVAGVFSLEDGLKLIAERGRLMQALPTGGAMAAIFASAEDVSRAIAPMADRVGIAAFNAPDRVVVSGEAAAVDALVENFTAREVQCQRLLISLAAHSPLVEPALSSMETCARSVAMRPPRIPVAWNVTGGAALDGGAPDAVYWRRHLREPVRFAEGIATLYRDGHRIFLEVGPHPTLIALARRSLPNEGPLLLSSLRRGKSDWTQLMTSLAQLQVYGARVDWAGVDRPYPRTRLTLPSYPFERRHFWPAPVAPWARHSSSPPRDGELVGKRLPTALPMFEMVMTPGAVPYLNDHRVLGAVLVPGPLFLELAHAAARSVAGPAQREVRDFVVREPLVLPEAGRTIQTHVGTDEAGGILPISIYSRAVDGSGEWTLHVTARLIAASVGQAINAGASGLAAVRNRLGPATSCDTYYAQLADLGIDLGPMFRSLRTAHRGDGEAVAEILLPDACAGDQIVWAHPTLLDGALQSVGLAIPESAGADHAYLLTEVERIQLVESLPGTLWCHAHLRNPDQRNPPEWFADMTLHSADGDLLGVITGLRLRRSSREALSRAVGTTAGVNLFYEVAWHNAPAKPVAARLLAALDTFAPLVRQRFSALSAQHGFSIYERLSPELDRLSSGHIVVALLDLGFDFVPGRHFKAAEELVALRVASRHARLFRRLLDILVEDRVLSVRGADFEVLSRPIRGGEGYEALLRRFDAADAELGMLRRCGPELARVLRGEQDPLQLLFSGGSFDEARKLYVDSPFAKTYNSALGEALKAAVARLPADARLHILEVGAGTGGTSAYVLPLLDAERTEYTFTDLSPIFLGRATEQFAGYPFMRTALLDIERNPLEQGFAAGKYDIIIAANVLHATADLKQTLQHVQRLMAPGALLFLLEGLAPARWVDLTFGLTEGWWRFTDTSLRPNYPLISSGRWIDLLQSLDFQDVVAIPDDVGTPNGAAQQGLIIARTPVGGRRWTLHGSGRGVAEELEKLLTARGDIVAVRGASAPATSLQGDVVYLGTLELSGMSPDDPTGLERAQTLANEFPQHLLAAAAVGEGRIWLVSQGAQAAGGKLDAGAIWQAPLWGWGRGFALEHPAKWGGLIDLPAEADPAAAAKALLTSLDADDDEDQTAWRGGQRVAARLLQTAEPPPAVARFRTDACYLVTGGFGGLGLVVARWMAEHGARHIALLGRHADPGADGVREIEALGCKVYALQGDVADEAAMRGVLAKLRAEGPPLRGVMHAAAAISAAPLTQLSQAQVSGMLRPKLAGTLVLERLTREHGLDFLVLFSSTTALLGASGLSHYAAANAFLDTFAQAANPTRRVISVNWGTWEVMRLASADSRRSFVESGLQPMAASAALDALGRILTGSRARAVVASINWGLLKSLHEVRRVRPLLQHLGATPRAATLAVRVAVQPELEKRLNSTPSAMRADLLVDFVQHEVAAVLDLENATAIPLTTGLFELGMDSLMAVELKNRLEIGCGRSMPSTLTFNYPNVGALAKFLETQIIAKPAAGGPVSTPVPTVAPGQGAKADLDALSDEELKARLMAHLEKAR